MNLYDKLREIKKTHKLSTGLKLRVHFKEKNRKPCEGYYDGYTDALDNEPEITQLEMRLFYDYPGTVSMYETEIEDIEVVE